MDALEQTISNFERFKDSQQSHGLKADCFMALLYLDEYKVHACKKDEDRRRRCTRHIGANVAKSYISHQTQHPVLLVNDHLVTKLFLYNIYVNATKKEITNVLQDAGCSGFKVEKVFHCLGKTSATLNCQSIAASCRIQCFAGMGKLVWKYNSGKSYKIKMKPHEELLSELGIPMTRHKPDSRLFTVEMLTLLSSRPVLAMITDYLNAEEFFALYKACHYSDSFLNLKVDFISSIRRYNHHNTLRMILHDAVNFKFKNILIRTCLQNNINSSILIKVLKAQAGKLHTLNVVDLTDVEVTDEVLHVLKSWSFIRKLYIGKTRSTVSSQVKFSNIEELHVSNNNELSLKFLNKQPLKKLKVLSVKNCKRIQIHCIADFIRVNSTLKTLSLRDSRNCDKETYDFMLLEYIFNGQNLIENWELSFTNERSPLIEWLYSPNLVMSSTLRSINITNNRDLEGQVSKIIAMTPCLEELIINGLKIDYALDFSKLRMLRRLSMDYSTVLNESLWSLRKIKMNFIKITNTLGKKKTKFLKLDLLSILCNNTNSLNVQLIKCKTNKPEDILARFHSWNISVQQVGEILTIWKKAYY